jgi:hypothetical protein
METTAKVLLALLLLAAAAEAGQPVKTRWSIPHPQGARFEVQTTAPIKGERVNGHEIRVEISAEASSAKSKARWTWGKASCYADGQLAQVLEDIDRCATKATTLK